jgi:hypothetical protein
MTAASCRVAFVTVFSSILRSRAWCLVACLTDAGCIMGSRACGVYSSSAWCVAGFVTGASCTMGSSTCGVHSSSAWHCLQQHTQITACCKPSSLPACSPPHCVLACCTCSPITLPLTTHHQPPSPLYPLQRRSPDVSPDNATLCWDECEASNFQVTPVQGGCVVLLCSNCCAVVFYRYVLLLTYWFIYRLNCFISCGLIPGSMIKAFGLYDVQFVGFVFARANRQLWCPVFLCVCRSAALTTCRAR